MAKEKLSIEATNKVSGGLNIDYNEDRYPEGSGEKGDKPTCPYCGSALSCKGDDLEDPLHACGRQVILWECPSCSRVRYRYFRWDGPWDIQSKG